MTGTEHRTTALRSEVQRANHYTTMPPPKYYKKTPKMYQSISLWAWPSTLQGFFTPEQTATFACGDVCYQVKDGS